MIQELVIDNHLIRYQINYKNNKNTYFHFKRDGYIQINAPQKMTEKKIKGFIIKNKTKFIKKFNATLNSTRKDVYYFFGEEYKKKVVNNTKKINLDHTRKLIYLPEVSIDQLNLLYKKLEKDLLLEKLNKLKERYLNNGLVKISKISFKTRYMETRFGSCNPKKNYVNINLYLLHFDEKYLEYVFLHEIAHLVHQNHSSEFYNLLKKLSINHKQLKKELNNKFINR